ncbi:hypothetical protein BGP_3821 [Beggiatoa sp. PS]|nr:hypothetical protein BGP_3821 [Beggiatoa sp. PS]
MQPYMPWHDTKEYALWIKQFDSLDQFAIDKMQNAMSGWSSHPTISILMPLNVPLNEQWLYEAISSVQQQILSAMGIIDYCSHDFRRKC